jgi:signal transduction histidine kinase
MKRVLLLVLFALGISWSAAFAADRATPDEAKAMAEKAAAFLKENGPEKAFAAFHAKDGGFQDRDLYVTVQDSQGTMVCHGTTPALEGKSMLNLKDVDGKAFNIEIQAVKDTGWVSFKWLNPVTKLVEPKKNYEIRVGDYLVGVGAYTSAQ